MNANEKPPQSQSLISNFNPINLEIPQTARPKMRDLDARIRALPAEVRVKIFAECVAPEFPPFRTPDLLVALRADARLYEEVLEAYYNTNQVEIKRHNRGIFMDLQTRRMAQIKRLAITL